MKMRTEILANKNFTSWAHLSAQQQLQGQVNFIFYWIQQYKSLNFTWLLNPADGETGVQGTEVICSAIPG